jgi:hypothetical protein
MTIDGRASVVRDDTWPAGREVIADRLDRTRTTVQEAADADRDSGPETLYLEAVLPAAIETARGVVATQISELGRAQRRVRTVAPVSDRAAVTALEPVPRIALTQQEACASLGCIEEFSVEHVRRRMRVVRRGCKRRLPADELRREAAEYTLCTGRSER